MDTNNNFIPICDINISVKTFPTCDVCRVTQIMQHQHYSVDSVVMNLKVYSDLADAIQQTSNVTTSLVSLS